MKIGKSYKFSEFLVWTRRKLYILLALAIVPVVVYQLLGQKWIAVPWAIAVLAGTVTSFIIGFKNAQTYARTVEAQQIWTAIATVSRYWSTICRDFPTHPRHTRTLIHRHIAWLTVSRLLEIELRELLGETELPPLLKPTNQIVSDAGPMALLGGCCCGPPAKLARR